jgi:hypothetical protein
MSWPALLRRSWVHAGRCRCHSIRRRFALEKVAEHWICRPTTADPGEMAHPSGVTRSRRRPNPTGAGRTSRRRPNAAGASRTQQARAEPSGGRPSNLPASARSRSPPPQTPRVLGARSDKGSVGRRLSCPSEHVRGHENLAVDRARDLGPPQSCCLCPSTAAHAMAALVHQCLSYGVSSYSYRKV